MSRTTLLRIGGVILALSSLVAIVIAVNARIREERHIACNAEVVNQLIVSWRARNASAERERTALREVFLEVTNSRSREQTLAALNKYNAVIATGDRERRENPIPEPPKAACR